MCLHSQFSSYLVGNPEYRCSYVSVITFFCSISTIHVSFAISDLYHIVYVHECC